MLQRTFGRAQLKAFSSLAVLSSYVRLRLLFGRNSRLSDFLDALNVPLSLLV